MEDTPVTLEVLYERIQQLERRLLERLRFQDVARLDLKDRVSTVESRLWWAIGGVAGGAILEILSLIKK